MHTYWESLVNLRPSGICVEDFFFYSLLSSSFLVSCKVSSTPSPKSVS
jgi:hypothetical protein